MTTGTRKTHDFCWLNVMTPDGDRAGEFFAQLLGWTYGDMPGVPGGRLILVGGKTAGALMDLGESQLPASAPPSIGLLVKVDSADDAVARVNALGGSAEPAFDALENGRMAMFTDPNGARLGVWQPRKQTGIDVDRRAHGAPSWFDTLTPDVGRATTFYTELFGWTPEEEEGAGEATYGRFLLGGAPVAGMMKLPEHMNGAPAFWSTYFTVDDADVIVKRGVELGGALCMPVQEIPDVGRFALLRSPQGVMFHLIEYAK